MKKQRQSHKFTRVSAANTQILCVEFRLFFISRSHYLKTHTIPVVADFTADALGYCYTSACWDLGGEGGVVGVPVG